MEPERRHRYVEAFIMSPKLKLAVVEVRRISEGIRLLEEYGEGELMVSTRKRPPGGYYGMATCTIGELRGKSQSEVYAMLDRRTDQLFEGERARVIVADRL